MPKKAGNQADFISGSGRPLMADTNLKPMDKIDGYYVRPGAFGILGATDMGVGVNFTIQSRGATSVELLLFKRKSNDPFATLKFPETYKVGYVYSMIVFGLDIEEFEYAYRIDGPYEPEKGLIFDKTKLLLDPYAKAVAGQSEWGVGTGWNYYHARVVQNDFDWGKYQQPLLPMQDLIIYELHVRGFTKHNSSKVEHPGTFLGLMEKVPYLKKLGVNAVELMPIFEFDEMQNVRERRGNRLIDYWGYNPVCFFSPNTSYTATTEYNHEGSELKSLIRLLHENDIEVILDVVFNHTAEGDEKGPFFSFKGFDNNVYYILTPEGRYYNFSGCGNTLNCNHPMVQQMILDCLRYWVTMYRVDGFRFDLASILGRNEDGTPMNKPPLLQSLAFDPILGHVKLIAEAWDAGGLYQVGSFPAWNRWAEWNGMFRDDMRSFLKGDGGKARDALNRIMGSPDLYAPDVRGSNASVNFITCHDGFTLNDLYSYNCKHNEKNGWSNADGSDDNRSWNCGIEGETNKPEIRNLRRKLMRNACVVLLCSRGVPMLLAGDEFCNSQMGNNNPYCQDNEISWLNWDMLQKNQDMFQFFQYMIRFRKRHPSLRGNIGSALCGFPEISPQGKKPTETTFNWDSRVIGVMFAGAPKSGEDDIVFLAVNAFWEEQEMELPKAPERSEWRVCVDTGEEPDKCIVEGWTIRRVEERKITLKPRSVQVLTIVRTGRQNP